MVSFHTLGKGNSFYLRESTQQIKQGKRDIILPLAKRSYQLLLHCLASAPWFPPHCSAVYMTQQYSEYLNRTPHRHRDR